LLDTIGVPPHQLLERILTLEIERVTERAEVSAARLRGTVRIIKAEHRQLDKFYLD